MAADPTSRSNRTKVVGEQVVTTAEVRSKLVDLTSGTSTVVCAGPALLRGANVNTTTSAHAISFANRGNTDVIPASTAAGTWIPFGDAYYPDGITAAYDGAATGTVNVKYIPLG